MAISRHERTWRAVSQLSKVLVVNCSLRFWWRDWSACIRNQKTNQVNCRMECSDPGPALPVRTFSATAISRVLLRLVGGRLRERKPSWPCQQSEHRILDGVRQTQTFTGSSTGANGTQTSIRVPLPGLE